MYLGRRVVGGHLKATLYATSLLHYATDFLYNLEQPLSLDWVSQCPPVSVWEPNPSSYKAVLTRHVTPHSYGLSDF